MHPDRRAQVIPKSTSAAKRKNRRSTASANGLPLPLNAAKTRLRSVRRLLQRYGASMPADQQVVLEREKQELEKVVGEAAAKLGAAHEQKEQGERVDVDMHEKKDQRSRTKAPKRTPREDEMVRRYHKIRFFERKQAAKRLRRAEKLLADADPGADPSDIPRNREDLSIEVHNRKVDLMYTQYFPLQQPYSSLYIKSRSVGEAAAAEENGKCGSPDKSAPKRYHPAWGLVEEAMEKGTLQELRDGTQNGPVQEKDKSVDMDAQGIDPAPAPSVNTERRKDQMSSTQKVPRNRRELRAQERERAQERGRQDEDSEGDGTHFFEAPKG